MSRKDSVADRLRAFPSSRVGRDGDPLSVCRAWLGCSSQQMLFDKRIALVNASFETIFLSEKGVCLDQYMTAEKMFGYSRKEAIGRHGTSWIVSRDRPWVQKNMMRVVKGNIRNPDAVPSCGR